MPHAVHVFWLCLSGMTGLLLTNGGAIPSYCQWETFNATCPEGHVILMRSAEYGRMRVGRCIATNYFTGCQSNVLDHMDERCSGRRSCTMAIPDPKLFNVQPCRKDLVAYLEADYDCVPVVNPLLDKSRKMYCRGLIDLVANSTGYLLSSVTAATGLGSRSCPWLIRAQPGQRINVTVYDFSGRASASAKAPRPKAAPAKPPCPVYAVLVEGRLLFGRQQEATAVGICSSEGRRRWVYTSKSSTLMVKMVNVSRGGSTTVNFMLKYEVIGCADLKNPAGAHMERKGDSLIISCNSSQETWHLVCKGTTWIGDYRNCSSAHNKMAVGDSGREEQGFPLGLLVAIAIGVVVGVVLGFVFLIGIFICRRRNRHEMKHDSGNPLMSGSGIDPEQQNIYRLVEVRPPPPMMCECHLAGDPKAIPALDSKVTLQTAPAECLYGTSPRLDRAAELQYRSPEVDNQHNQLAQQLKPCDIISDIQLADGVRCYATNPSLSSPNDTYPRIKPLPAFRGDRRLSSRSGYTAGEGVLATDKPDTTIYETRQ